MSVPSLGRVRQILTDIYNAITGVNPNTNAIVEEIRFLQRFMLGFDSAGGDSPFSFLDVVSFALYPGGIDEAGNATTHSIGSILSREFGDYTQSRAKFWLQEIRIVARRIELHLLPSSNETLSPGQLTEMRALLELLTAQGVNLAAEAALSNAWLQNISGTGNSILSELGFTRSELYIELLSANAYLQCLQQALAPDCEPVLPDGWPPVDPECVAGNTIVGYATPELTQGTAVQFWNFQWEAGSSFVTGSTAQGAGIQLVGESAVGLYFSVQTKGQFDVGSTGAGWSLVPYRTDGDPSPASRPVVDINNFSNCTDGAIFYSLNAGTFPQAIAYVIQFDTGNGGTPPTSDNVRIAIIQEVTS